MRAWDLKVTCGRLSISMFKTFFMSSDSVSLSCRESYVHESVTKRPSTYVTMNTILDRSEKTSGHDLLDSFPDVPSARRSSVFQIYDVSFASCKIFRKRSTYSSILICDTNFRRRKAHKKYPISLVPDNIDDTWQSWR